MPSKRVGLLAAGLAIIAIAAFGAVLLLGGGGDDPAKSAAVGYLLSETEIEVANSAGAALGTFRGSHSFDVRGALLVANTGSRADGLVPDDEGGIRAYDVATGEELFHIRSGAYPTILDERGRVAFWAVEPIDPQVNSIWLRELDGTIRKVVQFAAGPRDEGYWPDIEGNITLSTSYDRAGEQMAVAQGNDLNLFLYDVFIVEIASGGVTRITDDRRSRWPSISPDGRLVAYQQEVSECGADYIRGARLMVASTDGSDVRQLTEGSCDRWLHNPRWVSDRQLVAYVTSFDESGEQRTDLALVDTASGAWQELTDHGDVWFFSADADAGRVAYERGSRPGFGMLDVQTREEIWLDRGDVPHLAGDRTHI